MLAQTGQSVLGVTGMCLPQVSQLKPSMAKKQMAKVMSDMSLMFSDRITTQRVKRR